MYDRSISPSAEPILFHTSLIIGLGEESTSVRNEKTARRFLDVKFPLHESTLPAGKTFRKNQQYYFKFVFEVPHHLSEASCNHFICNDLIRKAHLQPPPSFGDPTIAGLGGSLCNDFAPPACTIIYTIQVKLNRKSYVSEKQQTMLQKGLKIRVKPTGDVFNSSLMYSRDQYCLEQSIDFPKGHSKSTSGRLVATLIAPEYFYLPLRGTDGLMHQTIRLSLRFEKNGAHGGMPRIYSLGGRITATTFFTESCHHDIPTKRKDIFGKGINFSDSILTTFSYSIALLQWTSEQSDCYSATLLVPIKGSHPLIIPTFHSCLISRIYTLDLQLKLHGARSIKLTAPMPILFREDQSILPSYSE